MTGIALLVVGVGLLVWGLNVSDSVGSAFSRAFTGSPTNKAIYLMLGGGLLSAAGLYVLFMSRRKR